MKNLLIPTDFSDCAEGAVRTGFALAERLEAKVHLLHVTDEAPTGAPDKALEAIRRRYPEVDSSASCRSGPNLRETIQAYVEATGIDLIVIGSHGVSGKSEYFIGSHTQRVVRTVRCPILVVKEAPETLDFRKVLFASSFNENEKEAFRRFKDFVKPFLPEIHLVAIHTSTLFEAPYSVTKEAMEDFRALSHPFKCDIHIFKDFTVDSGIRSFADEIGAELIGISNHHRHPIRRMLIGSNVEALVNHADVPVLSIDYPEP